MGISVKIILIVYIIFTFCVLGFGVYEIYETESENHCLCLKQDNSIELLIGDFYNELIRKDTECGNILEKQNKFCVLHPARFMGRTSLNGNLTTNVTDAGKYNIAWIRKGYKSPDGVYLTTCFTSE